MPQDSEHRDEPDGEMQENDDVETEAAGDVDMDLIGHIGSLEPSSDDFVSELMLAQLGGSKSCQREKRQAVKRVVSEIYSPPRVTQLIKDMKHKHLLPGFAFDLPVNDPEDGMPWDFIIAGKREKAREQLRKQKPYALIGSPECTAFATWQLLNQYKFADPEAKRRARIAAEVHMRFVISLYYEQIEGGGYFIHEHPLWATSWQLEEMAGLMQVPGVQRVRGGQCQWGRGCARRASWRFGYEADGLSHQLAEGRSGHVEDLLGNRR